MPHLSMLWMRSNISSQSAPPRSSLGMYLARGFTFLLTCRPALLSSSHFSFPWTKYSSNSRSVIGHI